tara:strand:- start:13092 stop:14060 length:969 start_codon:yes stop_codon:yes gene_type:complete
MNILITGVAGFIGYHLTKELIRKNKVIGVDNLNNYYDITLKKKRLSNLLSDKNKKNFKFLKMDLSTKKNLNKLNNYKFDIVIHLAAQAGIRYSLKRPDQYIRSNINGFFNIIEFAKIKKIKKVIFASSSSVYGKSKNSKFKENIISNQPMQMYAATKLSNELMAFSYHDLYKINFIGLRFFTVYGEWGRPDMAIFKFTDSILKNKKLFLYNNGNNYRDFTYISDTVQGIKKSIDLIKRKKTIFEIFNIGNNKLTSTKSYLNEIVKNLKIKPKIFLLKKQKGEMILTNADISKSKKMLKYKPTTSLAKGIKRYVSWFKSYYNY